MVYKKETLDKVDVVIAFSAANEKIDFNDEVSIFSQSFIPSQFYDALAFYNETKNYLMQMNPGKEVNISITGWSLGGALAQLVGAVTKSKTTTFGSP